MLKAIGNEKNGRIFFPFVCNFICAPLVPTNSLSAIDSKVKEWRQHPKQQETSIHRPFPNARSVPSFNFHHFISSQNKNNNNYNHTKSKMREFMLSNSTIIIEVQSSPSRELEPGIEPMSAVTPGNNPPEQ